MRCSVCGESYRRNHYCEKQVEMDKQKNELARIDRVHVNWTKARKKWREN